VYVWNTSKTYQSRIRYHAKGYFTVKNSKNNHRAVDPTGTNCVLILYYSIAYTYISYIHIHIVRDNEVRRGTRNERRTIVVTTEPNMDIHSVELIHFTGLYRTQRTLPGTVHPQLMPGTVVTVR